MNKRLLLSRLYAKLNACNKIAKLDSGNGWSPDSFARQVAHKAVQDFIDVYFDENLSENDIEKITKDLNNV